MVEQLAPLPGMAIAPGTPAGAGLIPGDGISVEPRGIPVGETVDPVSMPSGEVAPMVDVGLAIPPNWAIAALQTRSGERNEAINESLIGVFHFNPPSGGEGLDRSDLRRLRLLAGRWLARESHPTNLKPEGRHVAFGKRPKELLIRSDR